MTEPSPCHQKISLWSYTFDSGPLSLNQAQAGSNSNHPRVQGIIRVRSHRMQSSAVPVKKVNGKVYVEGQNISRFELRYHLGDHSHSHWMGENVLKIVEATISTVPVYEEEPYEAAGIERVDWAAGRGPLHGSIGTGLEALGTERRQFWLGFLHLETAHLVGFCRVKATKVHTSKQDYATIGYTVQK